MCHCLINKKILKVFFANKKKTTCKLIYNIAMKVKFNKDASVFFYLFVNVYTFFPNSETRNYINNKKRNNNMINTKRQIKL